MYDRRSYARKIRLILPREYFVYDGFTDQAVARDDSTRVDELRVGDKVSHDVAAPGCGTITYRVTRIDEKGAWGFVLQDTSRELTPAEVA